MLTIPEGRSIGQETKNRYAAGFKEFKAWAGARGRTVGQLSKNMQELDSVLVSYFEEL